MSRVICDVMCGVMDSAEDKSSRFVQNISNLLQHYMTSHPRYYAFLYKMAGIPVVLENYIGVLNCELFVMLWSPVAVCT